jgi:hypothetical protein
MQIQCGQHSMQKHSQTQLAGQHSTQSLEKAPRRLHTAVPHLVHGRYELQDCLRSISTATWQASQHDRWGRLDGLFAIVDELVIKGSRREGSVCSPFPCLNFVDRTRLQVVRYTCL